MEKCKFRLPIERGSFCVYVNVIGEIVVTQYAGMGNVGFHYLYETELAIIEDMISNDELVPTENIYYYPEIRQELLAYEFKKIESSESK